MSNAQQLAMIQFHEHNLLTINDGSAVYVAMRPICESIGLDWKAQYNRINRDPVLSEGVVIMTTPSAGGPQKTAVLPLDMLNGWLFGIDANRVKPELREMVLRYQRECYRVLADYWQGRSSQRGNVTQQVTLSRHRLSLLKELHRTRDRALRAAIHEQLAHTSRAIGLSVPELDSIGWADPEVPDILDEFWEALEQLDEKGVRYNHSLNAKLIALRLPQLRELFAQYSIRMEITGDLRNSLRQSRSPQYLDLKTVHSAIDGGSRKCWVFQR